MKIKICAVLLSILCSLSFMAGCASEIEEDVKIYCFSAGKADAFLISTDNSNVLIDCAESGFGDSIVNYLQSNNVNHLDYMIVTNFNKEHVGGAAKVINAIRVDNILQTRGESDITQYDKYIQATRDNNITPQTVKENYSFTLDEVEYTIIPPQKEVYDENDSENSSLIVSVKYKDCSFLFTSDIMDEAIKEFVDSNNEKYDFLKVPYHGDFQPAVEDLLVNINPKYALITSSADEKMDDALTSVLKQYGASVYFTKRAPVLLKCDGETIYMSYNPN
ncbi:MAG: MBL fold metallo-hydrolase [Clostridia bacterium]|nr:MBL fold metallo-hydrolase [Clostridia bacterium]